MPLPTDVYEIIYPSRNLLPKGWEDEFAAYKWFSLVGFSECLSEAKIFQRKEFCDPDICSKAVAKVPEKIKDQFPTCDWKRSFSITQMRNCKDYKNRFTFDRAYLAVICLEEVLKKKGVSLNAEKIKICPAFFRITGFTEDFYKKNFYEKDRLARLKRNSRQLSSDFFSEIAMGYGATYMGLELISKYINDMRLPDFDDEITPISNRSWSHRIDGIKPNGKMAKRPARGEIILTTL